MGVYNKIIRTEIFIYRKIIGEKMTNPNWEKYYKKTGLGPRKLLIKATLYLKNKDNALDLGAGNLRDTIYILKKGFKNIDVVDKQREVKECAENLGPRVHTHIVHFDKFILKKKYDIINAQYALPFMRKEKFEEFFEKAKKSLNTKGVITGQFFGERDSWKNKKIMTFINVKKAKKMLNGLKVVYFLEEEKDGTTALGEQKHWHVFHFIARKES